MAKHWYCTFQCPDSGQPIAATYAFGRIRLEGRDPDGIGILPETYAWISRHGGRRAYSIDEADSLIQELSAGQCQGFESR